MRNGTSDAAEHLSPKPTKYAHRSPRNPPSCSNGALRHKIDRTGSRNRLATYDPVQEPTPSPQRRLSDRGPSFPPGRINWHRWHECQFLSFVHGQRLGRQARTVIKRCTNFRVRRDPLKNPHNVQQKNWPGPLTRPGPALCGCTKRPRSLFLALTSEQGNVYARHHRDQPLFTILHYIQCCALTTYGTFRRSQSRQTFRFFDASAHSIAIFASTESTTASISLR